MTLRTRTRGSAPRAPMTEVSYFWNRPNVTNTFSGGFFVGSTESMTDVSPVKGFRRLVHEGGVVTNSMYQVKKTYTWAPGTREMRVTSSPPPYPDGTQYGATRAGNNGIGAVSTSLTLDETSLISEACVKCLANIEKPEVAGLVFLAELRQTLTMLRNPLAGALDFIKKVKGGSSGKLKSLADQHLTIVFGLRPFVNDIKAGLKAISNLTKHPPRKTARGFASTSRTWTTTRPYNDGSVKGTITVTTTIEIKVRAWCLYKLHVDTGPMGKFGLLATDIPAAIWELTPFSFVVDWFVNIGDLISALTPRFDITRLSEGYTIEKTTTIQEVLGPVTSALTGWAATGGGDMATFVQKEKTRVPKNLGSNVDFIFSPKINVGTITSAISLIIQRLK